MIIRMICSILTVFMIGLPATGREMSLIDSSMVLVPSGEFMMGKDSEKGRPFSPAHKVKVDSFFIDKHEVTNGEFLLFCEATGHDLPEFWSTDIFRSGEDYSSYPVIGVTWGSAKKYAEWVEKRLPTEAEWEYAARGGLIDQNFPNGDKWTKEKAKQGATGWINLIDPVGKYEPNGYGLYDMGGNAWEWVSDRFADDYYKTSPSDNPTGPEGGSSRVIRSGSWHSGAMCKAVYFRKGLPGNWCDFAVGFRCAKDIGDVKRGSVE
jgi:formylglycine-generating enzyme